MSQVLFDATKTQQIFVDAVFSGQHRQLLYGGAIRGGKSYVLMALVFILCRVYAGSRWAIVRKDLPSLRKNTLPVFEAVRPTDFCSPFNRSTWTARCTNESEILFWPESISHDPDLNRFRGLEVNGFFPDEINELQFATFLKMIERAGSWRVRGGGEHPPPLVVASCNPTDTWVKETFYDPWEEGTLPDSRFYLPATIDDNPYVDPTYRQSLNDLPEAEYRRFVLGDWTVNMDPLQLITWDWVRDAVRGYRDDGLLIPHVEGPRHLGVDVARSGVDKTVFAIFDGNALYAMHEHDGLMLDVIASRVITLSNDEGIPPEAVKVDAVGMGAGVVDACHGAGWPVQEILSGNRPFAEPGSFFVFDNRRSQMWWHVREKLRHGQLRILIPDGHLRKRLIRDLTSIRYRVRSDKTMEVEPKDGTSKEWGTKRRLGRSSDYGDAFVYALSRAAPRSVRAVLPPSISRATLV